MSLRMPQNLSTSPRFDTGLSVLEAELLGERAAVLGRLGREVETTLAALAAADSGDASGETCEQAPRMPSGNFLFSAKSAACWTTLRA